MGLEEAIVDKQEKRKYFGYVIEDKAGQEAFERIAKLIVTDELHFDLASEVIEDVDGSLYGKYVKGDKQLLLVSSEEDDDVSIISNVELQVSSLHEWTSDENYYGWPV